MHAVEACRATVKNIISRKEQEETKVLSDKETVALEVKKISAAAREK